MSPLSNEDLWAGVRGRWFRSFTGSCPPSPSAGYRPEPHLTATHLLRQV